MWWLVSSSTASWLARTTAWQTTRRAATQHRHTLSRDFLPPQCSASPGPPSWRLLAGAGGQLGACPPLLQPRETCILSAHPFVSADLTSYILQGTKQMVQRLIFGKIDYFSAQLVTTDTLLLQPLHYDNTTRPKHNLNTCE